MRARNFVRNTKYSLMMQFVVLLMGLVLPRLIIERYGSSVNGLKASITQILNILNLLQAGSLGATIFSLYEPLAKDDFIFVSRIMKVSRKYFHKIGLVFLLMTFIIAPIATHYVIDTDLSYMAVLTSFIILGVNASLSYFILSKYDVIFSADQKRHILSISGMIERIFYFLVLLAIINSNLNFIYMYFALIAGTFVKITYLEIYYHKLYVNRIKNVEVSKDEKVLNRHYVMITQISTQIVALSPMILITFFYNLKYVSVYSIYNIVQSMILMVLNTVYSSVSEIFGNLVALGNKEKTQKVFNLLNWLYILLGKWIIFCTIILLEPFVKIYTLNVTDMDYIVSNLDIMISLYLMSFVISLTSKNAINAFGLYRETSIFSLFTAVAALICSIVSAKKNIPLILIGPILFNLGTFLYSLIIIRKSKPWLFVNKIIHRLLPVLVITTVSIIIKQNIGVNYTSWSAWIVYASVVAILSGIILGCYVLLFEKQELKEALGYLKSLNSK